MLERREIKNAERLANDVKAEAYQADLCWSKQRRNFRQWRQKFFLATGKWPIK